MPRMCIMTSLHSNPLINYCIIHVCFEVFMLYIAHELVYISINANKRMRGIDQLQA